MSQPPFRSKPSSPSHSSPRRLLTPEERFGIPQETIPELSLVENTPPSEGHEVEASDPFAPYVRPKMHTRQHSPRRHELKHHEVKPHELKRHEVKRLERERLDPVGTAGRGPALANGVAARKEETRKKTSTFLKRFLGTALVLFVGYCGVAALSAPQFAVKNVRIEGLNETPKAKVEAITNTLVGQNFFRANRAKVEQAVGALPTVASAHVAREAGWPPRLKLVVDERRPVLRVGAGEEWWVVDEAGVPFRKAEREDTKLYAITAKQFEPKLGKPLVAKWWNRALDLEKALNADNALVNGGPVKDQASESEGTGSGGAPFWQLRRLYLDRQGMASIRIAGRGALRQHNEMLIRLGESDWEMKLARARVALSYFERTGRNAQELDLVSYTYPTWRAKTNDDSGAATPARIGMTEASNTLDTRHNG